MHLEREDLQNASAVVPRRHSLVLPRVHRSDDELYPAHDWWSKVHETEPCAQGGTSGGANGGASSQKHSLHALFADEEDHMIVVSAVPKVELPEGKKSNLEVLKHFDELKDYVSKMLADRPPDHMSRLNTTTSSTQSSPTNNSFTNLSTKSSFVTDPSRTCWIDIQAASDTTLAEVLELFPLNGAETILSKVVDTLETYPSHVALNLLTSPVQSRKLRAAAPPNLAFASPPLVTSPLRSPSGDIFVGIVCFDDVIITLRKEPCAAMLQLAKTVHHMFDKGQIFSSAQLLYLLVEYAVERQIPDIASVLREVSAINATLLRGGFDAGVEDPRRAMIETRRCISEYRSVLYRKEMLLLQFLDECGKKRPLLSRYDAALQLTSVLQSLNVATGKLERARISLQKTTTTFASKVSIQMSKLQNKMDSFSKTIAWITFVFLPINWVLQLLAMNCALPYGQAAGNITLTAFIVEQACFVVWGITVWMALKISGS